MTDGWMQKTKGLRTVVLAALATLAVLMATVSPAAASEPADWGFLAPVSTVADASGTISDLSGVAVGEGGVIYGVDNGDHTVVCLAQGFAGGWTAENISSPLSEEYDIEGITWVDANNYVLSYEDIEGGANASNASGALFATIESNIGTTSVTENSTASLLPITELSGAGEVGGAEGITWVGGTEYLVVQEGVGNPAVPRLYRFDSSTDTVTFLFNLTGINDAAGVAADPTDPNSVWVLSEDSKTISKYNLTTGTKAPTEISLSTMNQPEGMAFSPDGLTMVVVGEGAEIAVLQQTGYAGNPDPPIGACEGLGKVVPLSTSGTDITRPLLVLLGLVATTGVLVARRPRLLN